MTDSVLIVGAGVTGLTAALECAAAGARAVVVERGPVVGGAMAAAITDDSSVGESIDGEPVPKIARIAASERIEVISPADLLSIDGRPGNFTGIIRERARFVDDSCTRCNHCRPVCPSVRPNEYDAGLSYRKAIYTPLPQTLPDPYVIDIDSCLNTPPNYLPCNRCVEVCDDHSIHFDLPLDQRHERQFGAVIVATGFETVTTSPWAGVHPDIVTSDELQRLMVAPGPTGGFASKPSDEEYPASVLVILDELTPFAAYVALSQLRQLTEQAIDRVALLVTAQPEAVSGLAALEGVPADVGIRYGLLRTVEPHADGGLAVSYADFASSRVPEECFDMVVLGPEVRPAAGLAPLAAVLGIDLAESGFVARDSDGSATTSAPGIYAAGGACGPIIFPAAVGDARTAARAALGHIDPRLLLAGDAPIPDGDTAAAPDALPDEAMRARIERMLNALIDKGT